MKIIDVLKQKQPLLSFEIFPPNDKVPLKEVMASASRMAAYNPDFMSVTYKAGGGSGAKTVEITHALSEYMGIPAMSHLTCATTPIDEISNIVDELKNQGIDNILALRGDRPTDFTPEMNQEYFPYAKDLVAYLHTKGDFSIGAAAFPEGSSPKATLDEDIHYLQEKIDCGVDFLITQMFYDNDAFFRYYDKILKAGIHIPILPGIMPVTNGKQMKRIAELSGASIPKVLKDQLDRYGDDPQACIEIGTIFALGQISHLLSQGVAGIHLYTMNKPEVARRMREGLGNLVHHD